jgi:hypothetical protein
MNLGMAAVITNPVTTQIDHEDINVILVQAVIRAGIDTFEFFSLWNGLIDRGINPVNVLREALTESN